MTCRAAVLLLAICASAPADEPKGKSAEELAEQVKPSLCVITTRGREAKREGLGTGFVVAADGLIATNAHVIGQGRPISVEFADGTKYDVLAVHAEGRVQGIVTLKGFLTENLAFATTVNDLKPLLAKPNPVPMDAWVTIGA